MTPSAYECAMLANVAYRAAKSDDTMEVLCVACVFRNRVLRYGKTYTQVLEAAEISRPWPAITNPVMIDPTNGILSQVEAIYRNELPDMTANHLQKDGALWFCRPFEHQDKKDFMDLNILSNPNEHPLIGQFGSQCFYV